jgi:hypothetical protein
MKWKWKGDRKKGRKGYGIKERREERWNSSWKGEERWEKRGKGREGGR